MRLGWLALAVLLLTILAASAQPFPNPTFGGLTLYGYTGCLTGNGTSPVTAVPCVPSSVAPFSPQLHQNSSLSGSDNSGHVLMWTDQNDDRAIDHIAIATQDHSILEYYLFSGTATASGTVTYNFELGGSFYPVVYTIQAGDTPSTIPTAFAACINGGSTHCTGGAAFLAADKAYLGPDGIGYWPQANGAAGATLAFDYPWAASGNGITVSISGSPSLTIVNQCAGANPMSCHTDLGPNVALGRLIAGRTPLALDQFGAIQFTAASGPNTGIDTASGYILNQYVSGGAGTPFTRLVFGGAAGATSWLPSWNTGPQGAYTADTAGDGNPCNIFSPNNYGDPGYGNISACGQLFVGGGSSGASGINPANSAIAEFFGLTRVDGSAHAPSTGAGLEFQYSGGAGAITPFDRGASQFKELLLQGSSIVVAPNGTPEITFDALTGVWPLADNAIALGKTTNRYAWIYSVGGTFNSVTLGVAGTSVGSLTFANATSGSITLQPPTGALGSAVITFGTNSGTPAVTASSPLAISTATGGVSCATCATTASGGPLSGVGMTQTSSAFNSNAEQTITFQPGSITGISNNKSAFVKWAHASTVDNIEGSAETFTCSGNPVITLYECGTSATCATPTTIGSATVTATGTVVDGTVASAAIAAGDYTAWAISAGTCTVLDIAGTAQVHSN